MSYRCTKNLGSRISMHNSKIMTPRADSQGGCNCRKIEDCPVEGQCLKEGVVYQATVEQESGQTETYIGMNANSFKTRWRNHTASVRNKNLCNSTVLAKHVWEIKERGEGYSLSWKIVARASAYNHVTSTCRLCLRENFFIVFKPEMSSLNSRNEIAGHCPHKISQLLVKS